MITALTEIALSGGAEQQCGEATVTKLIRLCMTEDQAASPQSKRAPISATMRAAIWQAHGRRCAYTGEYVSLTDVEIDHVIPIATTQEEFNKLVSSGVIPRDFDLNGLPNLLPTTSFQNSRKRARLRTQTNLRHFLEVAEQYRPAVEAYLRASLDEGRSLNSYLQLKAQAERNNLEIEDIIDINRQQAEGLTRIRHIPELADTGDMTLLNKKLAQALLVKPFALGGGSITEVVLQNNAGQKTICGDCASFLEAKANGLWAYTQFDINCESMANRTCETLLAIERAKYAPASLVRYPRITCKQLTHWSADWIRSVRVDYDEASDGALFAKCKSIADLVDHGACNVVEATDWKFDIHPSKGLALQVSELFRADLDNDGAEEILVFNLVYAPAGTLRAGTVVVAKPRIDGLIYPVFVQS